MKETREEILEERRRLKAEYRWLFNDVAAILFRHDPVGINFETNQDEYEPEVGTILPRLLTCHSAVDVRRVVCEEFARWFDAETASPEERFTAIAAESWGCWERFVSN
jgi:hypothetical protein